MWEEGTEGEEDKAEAGLVSKRIIQTPNSLVSSRRSETGGAAMAAVDTLTATEALAAKETWSKPSKYVISAHL